MSVPSDDEILSFLEAQPKPLNPKAIGRGLGLQKNDLADLKKALRRLAHAGRLSHGESDLFGPPQAENKPGKNQHRDKPDHKQERRNSHRRFPESNPNPADGVVPAQAAGGNQHNGKREYKSKRDPVNIVGIIVEKDGALAVRPCNKKYKDQIFDIIAFGDGGAKAGDVVVVEATSKNTKYVKVTKVLGHKDDPGMISTISLHEQGIQTVFSQAALDQARDPVKMAIPAIGDKRLDKRTVPFVTIDGPDSRDFDDAVFAEKTENGWHMMVAIADVSWYVRPGDALDQDAYIRGNSTYFPDRAEPMLPKELSNGVCSLNPGVDRAVIVRERWIDNDGNLLKKLPPYRALINSAARLTYEQIQAAHDGKPDAAMTPLMDSVVTPLYGAFESLAKARAARGTLDLNLPERKVKITAEQGVEEVKRQVHLNSHSLVEEFMLAANEDAAASLEEMNSPCVYRIHPEPPSKEKLDGIRDYAAAFGLQVPDDLQSRDSLRDVLAKAAQQPYYHLIAELILRAQGKASYSTENIGHYGLALGHYAHFTSPIRRYADLLVHRLLVTAFNLGAGGISKEQLDILQQMADHVTETEIRSDEAGRNSDMRYAVTYLAKHIGENVGGQISSVNEIGMFIKLDDTGVMGFIPRRQLPKDYYDFDRDEHALFGRDFGRVYRAGAPMEVRLKAADPITGLVDLSPANDQSADIPGFISKRHPPSNDNGGIDGGRRLGGPQIH